MTLPEQLRKWADNRDRLRLDSKVLRRAANEIEQSRVRTKELYEERNRLRETLAAAGECIDQLAEQQAMPDDWYLATRARIQTTLREAA